MDTLAQQPMQLSSVAAPYRAAGSRQGQTDCFLTFANQLVEEILVEYGIDVTRNKECEAA